MNTDIGIKKDKEIIQVQCPTEIEVGEYEEEGDAAKVQPSLDPMCPYLSPVPKLSWNARLWDLLLLDIQANFQIEHDALPEMEEAFYKRLERLFRTRKGIVESNENDEEGATQKRDKELRNKQRQRASTRRQTVCFFCHIRIRA